MRKMLGVFVITTGLAAGAPLVEIRLAGVAERVEILRDRWGVPHIYAKTQDDLFFAQGYIAARDRLFQIDLWRRIGTGKLAEVLGPDAIPRDTLARAVGFRGDWNAEWAVYAPDAKAIATAFTKGINAYIRSLGGSRPLEFRTAGYDPGLWAPEDCTARVAGLLMTRNLASEVARAEDALKFGLATLERFRPPDPLIRLQIPSGLDLADVSAQILRVYRETIGPVQFQGEQGSNNWVVDGTMSVTGKPILANDPHRLVQIPSLRKTVHLVGPGWNVIGAGEPALPGIALGHNEHVAFGFTIVGIDQDDLYVERLDKSDPDQYLYRGFARKMEIERQALSVKGRERPEQIELRFTIHGPVISIDQQRGRAYALKWVGSQPGTAGYLAGLSLARAKNWREFLSALDRYKVPSENLVYADTEGNIGWQAAGMAPIRKNWSGLFPVPGDSGEYEWSGFRRLAELPRRYNPPEHYIATANHNILPRGYTTPIGYEWALPFRFQRIDDVLSRGRKFGVADFEQLQQDVFSLPARRFQSVLRRWNPPAESPASAIVRQMLAWDASIGTDSPETAIFEVWMAKLPAALFGAELGARANLEFVLRTLESTPDAKALASSLEEAIKDIEKVLGPDRRRWRWGALHQVHFQHPLNVRAFDRGPIERPGDANTVNSTSGANFRQTGGASYRQIVDVADWDRSVMTNVPGESGDPESPHYDDLLAEWAQGKYHPMPFSRKAVEAAAVERITLVPAR